MNIKNYKNNIYIYNSLTNKKELFSPIHKNYIGIYVCGPTVYHHLHLGNCRTFIFFDLIFRYFKHLGYKIRYIRNITDVGHLENENGDDKIYKKSCIEGIEPMEIVQKYTLSFHHILSIFNTIPPNIEPTATSHIIEQIDFIKKLIKKNLAYEKNSSIYFDIKKYNQLCNFQYGILSHNKIDSLYNKKKIFLKEKRHFQDFSLWKKAKKNHIMNWDSPWGKGFPGWHIECTTMSTKYLGNIFDIHGGGVDLKFPHHECELAQSIGIYNNKMANYWMHTNMLTLNGKKMSKSTGNFFSLKNLIIKKHDHKTFHPTIIRFFILKTHYRSLLNFSYKGLFDAEKGYYRLIKIIKILKYFSNTHQKTYNKKNDIFDVNKWIIDCYKAINDDFNTPLLISHLFKIYHIIHSTNVKISNLDLLNKYIKYFIFDIMGLQMIKNNTFEEISNKLKILTEQLIKIRIEERKKKNWIFSDKIRKILSDIGITLHDDKLFI